MGSLISAAGAILLERQRLGLLSGMGAMFSGGCVITLPSAAFDAEELLDTIDKHRPTSLIIVGDSFGKPIPATDGRAVRSV